MTNLPCRALFALVIIVLGSASGLCAEVPAPEISPLLLEVDRLLAEAGHSYDLANYEAASDTLAKASALYKGLYPGLSYPPLDSWIKLVRMALDAGNTRVIRRNDPLFREMSQYLSLARIDYDNGLALKKAGRAKEALTSFAAARALIANVTRTFPLNADAGFLTLLILKATNEADFRASLQSRITEAAALLRTDPVSGYARVADLAGIEPRDQRLLRLLSEAEIATGRRKPEPSAAERRRSALAVDQARQLMKSGRQSDMALAEQQLKEALALEEDNREAQTLLLGIQTMRGSAPDLVLGPDEARAFETARAYYAQGQYNQSREALDPLLAADPTRARDVLLLDAQLKQLGY
ncbi:MAG: hypothetical protein WCL50_12755 [Spirochaetota bacterium]